MPPLPEPMEILDLDDGGTLQTKIVRWEDGQAFIKTTKVPEGKTVDATRIHVPKEAKAHFPWYYDITAKTLRAQLVPLLDGIVRDGRTVKITKHGVAPSARFTMEVI